MDWRPVEGFPNYLVSQEGVIKHIDTDRERRFSRTQRGAVKVTLFNNGIGYTRSLPLLVAKAWVYNDHDPEIFDTPIHLDNNPKNNQADNLMWRPRWFAVKYQQQYWNEEYRLSVVVVEDLKTGEFYQSIMGPCQKYGLLFADVLDSCSRGTEVFPTWKLFRFV